MKFMKNILGCLFFFDVIQGSTGMDGMFGQPGQRGKQVIVL